MIFDRFFYDPLELIAPLAMKLPPAISLRELKKLPLIMRDPTGNLMSRVVHALRRAGVTLDQMNVAMQVAGSVTSPSAQTCASVS